MRRNRIAATGGDPPLDMRRRRRRRDRYAEVRRTLRALGRLVRARRRIEHVPTLMQVRAMAHFDGREPSSYLLDPSGQLRPRAAARRRGPAGAARPALHR